MLDEYTIHLMLNIKIFKLQLKYLKSNVYYEIIGRLFPKFEPKRHKHLFWISVPYNLNG